MNLVWAIALREFRRRQTYRSANLAGLITNAVFGFLRTAVFLSLFQLQPVVAGYDTRDIITYSWLIQALIMVVHLWGWYDVEATIRSGDVVTDLFRPLDFLYYWLARDVGRAAFFALFRGLPILAFGQVVFGLRMPIDPLTWLAFAASVLLGVMVSFCWRFAINLSAFWTTDARGLGLIGTTIISLACGFILPLHFFPEPIRTWLLLSPFAGVSQTPVDIFLGRLAGADAAIAIATQLAWAITLLAATRALVAVATRRVIIQGG